MLHSQAPKLRATDLNITNEHMLNHLQISLHSLG